MSSVTIPDSVTSIGDEAFYGCNKLTIYGYKDSTAEKYAKQNNITFKELSSAPEQKPDPEQKPNPDTPKTPTPTQKLHFGNIDGDDSVTSSDALKILRASVDLEKLTDDQRYFADVNGDNMVDSADSLAVLRYSVGYADKGVTIGFDK